MDSDDVSVLESLRKELSRLSTTQDKLATITRWMTTGDASRHAASTWGRSTSSNDATASAFAAILAENSITPWAYSEHLARGGFNRGAYVLDVLPCAHVVPKQAWKCLEAETRMCSGCKLVKYC
jgi:hypothetical protein